MIINFKVKGFFFEESCKKSELDENIISRLQLLNEISIPPKEYLCCGFTQNLPVPQFRLPVPFPWDELPKHEAT